MPGFFVLALGHALGHDAAADRRLPPAAAGGNRANQNAAVERAVEAQVGKRAAVGATRRRLELGDDLHRPDFRRACDRSAGKRRPQQVERVNYDAAINGRLTVYGQGGNDVFAVDDNSAITTLDGGEGNDNFQIGQLYGSKRDSLDPNTTPGITSGGSLTTQDVFGTVATTRGWLSAGNHSPLVAVGDKGDDVFTVYSNQAALRLEGGDDNDQFVVRAFALAAVVVRRSIFSLDDEIVALPPTDAGRRAIADVVDAFLSPLTAFAAWTIGIAAVVAFVAWVTGPYRWAVAVRERGSSLVRTAVTSTAAHAGDRATQEWIGAHRDPVLAAIAAKAVKELTYHRDYAGRWFLTLAQGTEESRRRLLDGLAAVWPLYAELAAAYDAGPDVDVVLDQVFAVSGVERPDVLPMAGAGHTEALSRMLAEMQVVARAHPMGQW